MHYFANGQPKHAAERRADSTPTARCDDRPYGFCARHTPADYAQYGARHSIDSIGPLNAADTAQSRLNRLNLVEVCEQAARAERFHNFGITR